MQSYTRPGFWKAYRRLPKRVRKQARVAFRLFSENPLHPGLRFKRVGRIQPVYSVRVSRDCRALGVRSGDTVVWFWIGTHDEYERIINLS